MKILLAFFSLLMFDIAYAQTKPHPDLHQVKPGMSEAEVRKLVGDPLPHPYITINKNAHDTETYWDYPPEQTVHFVQHKVTRVDYNQDEFKTRMKAAIEKNIREGKKMDTTKMSPVMK